MADEIEYYRNQFKNHTDEQLIVITCEHGQQNPVYIAAKIILEERKRMRQTKSEIEILKTAKGANRWAFFAFLIGLLSFLALVTFWTYDHFGSIRSF